MHWREMQIPTASGIGFTAAGSIREAVLSAAGFANWCCVMHISWQACSGTVLTWNCSRFPYST
jgi:hypothetical protein